MRSQRAGWNRSGCGAVRGDRKFTSEQNSDNEEIDEEDDGPIHSPPESPNMSHYTDGALLKNGSKSDEDSQQSDYKDAYFSADEDTPEDNDPHTAILSVPELEDLSLRLAPNLSSEAPS